jgi:hypothetical protein
MKPPLIAIVGSVDEARKIDPPLKNPMQARQAAEAVGRALAEKGHRILVYTAEAGFLETFVVKGYVASGKAKPKSIVARFPIGNESEFAEYAANPALFHLERDRIPDWETSYYRSLRDVDGVVLIGGGRSTLITGLIAVTLRIPVVAALAYGGKAEEVWKVLDSAKDLPSAEEINTMAKPGTADVPKEWVNSLEAQRQARQRLSFARQRITAVAALLLVGWVITLPVGFIILKSKNEKGELPWPWDIVFVALLFISPLVAGSSGATLRALLPGQEVISAGSSVLGAAAGAIASLLYVGAQLLSSGASGGSPNNFPLLLFAVGFGFIAGLTFDSVFKKLESINALEPDEFLKRKG